MPLQQLLKATTLVISETVGSQIHQFVTDICEDLCVLMLSVWVIKLPIL